MSLKKLPAIVSLSSPHFITIDIAGEPTSQAGLSLLMRSTKGWPRPLQTSLDFIVFDKSPDFASLRPLIIMPAILEEKNLEHGSWSGLRETDQ